MEVLILVRADQKENAFGRYAGEILRAEGFNWYRIEEMDGQDLESLSRFPLVILTHCFVDQRDIEVLLHYARNGGRLVCLRPCLRLAQALGLEATYAAQRGGYLRINAGSAVGQGLCTQSLQIHGMADHWMLPEDSHYDVGTWLLEHREDLPEYPALLWGSLERGRVAIFSYDLSAAVACIRQGDPARANNAVQWTGWTLSAAGAVRGASG